MGTKRLSKITALNKQKDTMTIKIKNLGLLLATSILLTSCNIQSDSNKENTPENGELNKTFVETSTTKELTPEQNMNKKKKN